MGKMGNSRIFHDFTPLGAGATQTHRPRRVGPSQRQAHRGPIQQLRVRGLGRCGAGGGLLGSTRVRPKSQSAPCCWEQPGLWRSGERRELAALSHQTPVHRLC